jgi:hypothetical protein
MMSKYKLITENKLRGVWFSELNLIKLIQISYTRNKKLSKELISHYEYLEDKNFDYSLVGEFTKE